MLNEKEIFEVREHLEKAQNPVFFYDNDLDGLCSYILLRRFLGKGKGVAVRTHPDLDVGYAKKVQQLDADYVFVLDRPILGKEFVEEIKKLNLPLVWIDHHQADEEDYNYDNLFIFNPTINKDKNKRSNEPVTYWAHKIAGKREDIWLAVMGCVSDHYLPDFSSEFGKKWPEFWSKNIKEPFDAYYNTEIGRLARALGFGLKDSITHVVYLQNFLINSKGPNDVFLELESKSSFAKKYREIREKYDSLLGRAKKNVIKENKVIFFSYGGDLSISADISNELSYLYSKYFIIISYTAPSMSNLSIRGDNVRAIIDKVLLKFKNSSGGGHRDAVGVRLQTVDLERFKKQFEREVDNGK